MSARGGRTARIALGLALVGVLVTGAARAGRVVAVGDIHGAYSQLVATLRAADLLDARGHWSGGAATLVQTGDIFDRGAEVRACLDLLMRLQAEAPDAGGRVVVLLGNHEAMNLLLELRDANPQAFVAFADGASDELRETSLARYLRYAKRRARETHEAFDSDRTRAGWRETHPTGLVEYLAALEPDGRYGRWLRTLPAVARVEDTLFVHGGISPELAAVDIESLNRRLAEELARFDRDRAELLEQKVILPAFTLGEIFSAVGEALELQRGGDGPRRSRDWLARLNATAEHLNALGGGLLMGATGPLWFRGFARWSPEEGRPAVESLLAAHGVRRIVAGHSPPSPPGRIQLRFGGALILIDTGMLPGHYSGGRASALEIRGDRLVAIYPGAEVEVLVAGPTASGGAEPAAVPARPGPPSQWRPLPVSESSEGPPEATASGRALTWLGADGVPLPFQGDDEILSFLRHARVVTRTEIREGVTRKWRLLLERGGVQARAVFRTVDVERERVRMADGTVVMHLYDRFVNEVAAYELGRLLGLDNIPPVVLREIDGTAGSVQLWIENARRELDRRKEGVTPPNEVALRRRLQDMTVFDNLINNIDRNLGNILIDDRWRLWMIDHTRSFGRDRNLPHPEAISRCSRRLWRALADLDLDRVKATLDPYLGTFELKALLSRHRRLIALLEDRIAQRGEERVLFTYGEPEVPVTIEVEPPTAALRRGSSSWGSRVRGGRADRPAAGGGWGRKESVAEWRSPVWRSGGLGARQRSCCALPGDLGPAH